MKLFILIYLTTLITMTLSKSINILTKRDHGTRDPDAFSSINRHYAVTAFDRSGAAVGTLYTCEIYRDGTKIKCSVDLPWSPDDTVTFNVKQSKAYDCTKKQ